MTPLNPATTQSQANFVTDTASKYLIFYTSANCLSLLSPPRAIPLLCSILLRILTLLYVYAQLNITQFEKCCKYLCARILRCLQLPHIHTHAHAHAHISFLIHTPKSFYLFIFSISTFAVIFYFHSNIAYFILTTFIYICICHNKLIHSVK